MNPLDLVRGDLRTFTGYQSARSESSQTGIMLNANELPWAVGGSAEFNRYPDPQPRRLRELLADFYQTSADNMLISRGSDEGIDLLSRGFCQAGRDSVVVCPPTFGMYAVSASIQGAKVINVPLQTADFSLDMDAVLAHVDASTKLVYICSPNNPTGGLVKLEDIKTLAAALEGQAIVVVDEAYIEFAGTPSAISLLDDYPHVVVLRTMSKVWGLAGVRIGVLIACPEIIKFLRAIMSPYPLPKPSVQAALEVLDPARRDVIGRHIKTLKRERERLELDLMHLPQVREVLPSVTNFLCVRFEDARASYAYLLDKHMVVRDATGYKGLHDALRITVGTPDENTRLLNQLADQNKDGA